MDFQLLEDVLKGVEAVGEKLDRKNTSVFLQTQTCVHTLFLLLYSLLFPSLREIKSRGGGLMRPCPSLKIFRQLLVVEGGETVFFSGVATINLSFLK